MKVIQKWKPEKNPILISKTETKWQNFLLSSRSLRLGGKNLVLVSKHKIERKKFLCSSRSTRLKERKSRSRLEAWDRNKEILDPVSDTRLKDRYSRSRLESWDRALVGHWHAHTHTCTNAHSCTKTLQHSLATKTAAQWQLVVKIWKSDRPTDLPTYSQG